MVLLVLLLLVRIFNYFIHSIKNKRPVNLLIIYVPLITITFGLLFFGDLFSLLLGRFSEGFMVDFETTLNALTTYRFFIAKDIVSRFIVRFDFFIFGVFLASESILGLIPPDIFIAWTKNTESPLLYLAILAFLSYLGGVIAYFMGMAIAAVPSINKHLYGKMSKHIINMQKWGGFLIAVGALLPLPFAIACLAAGMINYSRKHFFLFGLLRFFRFIIYGFVIYSALS